jgi:hypothetical protein
MSCLANMAAVSGLDQRGEDHARLTAIGGDAGSGERAVRSCQAGQC